MQSADDITRRPGQPGERFAHGLREPLMQKNLRVLFDSGVIRIRMRRKLRTQSGGEPFRAPPDEVRDVGGGIRETAHGRPDDGHREEVRRIACGTGFLDRGDELQVDLVVLR